MEPLQKDLFRVVNKRRMDENRIFMLSDSPKFLEEKWNLIREYTLKVDPKAPIASRFVLLEAIKTIPLAETKIELTVCTDPFEDILNEAPEPAPQAPIQEYKYMIRLHEILPRVLTTLYGDHSMVRFANCHSTALLMAGVLPGPFNSRNFPHDLPLFNKLNSVALETLSSGDFVNIRHHSHSFVFLDHDISLTANGCGAPIVIESTSAILKQWGVKEDALKVNNPKNRVEIYRKMDSWKLPEELMEDLVPLYRMAENSWWFETPKGLYHVQVRTLYRKISNYFDKMRFDASIPTYEYQAWKNFFDFFQHTHIPVTLKYEER